MKKIAIGAILSAVLALAGCGSALVQFDDNEYQINAKGVWTYSGGTVLNDLVQEARAICAQKGRKFKMLNNKTNDAYEGFTTYAGATLHFACVNPETGEK